MFSDDTLLEFHRRSRDSIRAVLTGLDEPMLRAHDPERGFSIAEEVGHLVAAEHWFLSEEYGVDPAFSHMDRVKGQKASARELRDHLDQIEQQWPRLLQENPNSYELRVVLARMALHTLYHLARVADRRARLDPEFELPHWSEQGSWEYAIEPLLQSLRT